MVSVAVSGAEMSSRASNDLVCVSAHSVVAIGGIIRLPLEASSCALVGGR